MVIDRSSVHVMIGRQDFILIYVGLAATTGYPVEITILIRALTSSIWGQSSDTGGPPHLDAKLLQVLDAGTFPGDPSAQVQEYMYGWWMAVDEPTPPCVLGPSTFRACLDHHRIVCFGRPDPTTFEKPHYSWGQGVFSNKGTCSGCAAMSGIVTAATDELRELRLMVDAVESTLDMERNLSNRRASGAHALMTSALLKEADNGMVSVDSATGLTHSVQVGPSNVEGTVRLPRRGSKMAERLRQAAEQELQQLQIRPNLKWTASVDLDVSNLRDMLGSRYNNALEGSHSGYDTELEDGILTANGSDGPSEPLVVGPIFDNLSPDIIDPPALMSDEVPTIFNHHPFRLRDPMGSELAGIIKKHFDRHGKHGQKSGSHIIPRPVTPDLELRHYTIPPVPNRQLHHMSDTGLQSSVALPSSITLDLPDATLCDIEALSTIAEWDPEAMAVDGSEVGLWPPIAESRPGDKVLESEPGSPVLPFSLGNVAALFDDSSDREGGARPGVASPPQSATEASTLSLADVIGLFEEGDTEAGPHSATPSRLAISQDTSQAGYFSAANVAGMFAGSSDDEPLIASGAVEDVQVGEEVQAIQVQNVAGLFGDDASDDSESMPDIRHLPEAPLMDVVTSDMDNTQISLTGTATVRDIVGLFSDDSSNEDITPDRHAIILGHTSESPPITLDQVGQLFADSSEDDDEDAEGDDDLEEDSGEPNISENTSAARGPYTSMTFQNIPDNWLEGI